MSDYTCGQCEGVSLEQIDDDAYCCPSCGTVFEISEDEEDDGEALSEWDAADIYFSSGCDEDCMFGYSEDELINAHNS